MAGIFGLDAKQLQELWIKWLYWCKLIDQYNGSYDDDGFMRSRQVFTLFAWFIVRSAVVIAHIFVTFKTPFWSSLCDDLAMAYTLFYFLCFMFWDSSWPEYWISACAWEHIDAAHWSEKHFESYVFKVKSKCFQR